METIRSVRWDLSVGVGRGKESEDVFSKFSRSEFKIVHNRTRQVRKGTFDPWCYFRRGCFRGREK